MSILGKLLIVFNGLLALGFLALAAVDWGTRQAWSYADLRHTLVLEGLPLDANETWPASNEKMTAAISDQTLADLFGKARGGNELGGGPVRTQQDEVERVRGMVRRLVESADGERAKRIALYRFLLPKARTGPERDELAARIDAQLNKDEPERPPSPNRAPLADLLKELDARFAEAARPLPGSGGEPLDRTTKHLLVARLLYGLDPEPVWHLRVQTVVGLRAYESAVSQLAADLAEMNQYVHSTIVADQLAFEQQYRAILAQLPGEQRRVADLKRMKEAIDKLLEEHQQLVNARKEDVKGLEAALAGSHQETTTEKARLAIQEQTLFEYQRRIGEAETRNAELERELRRLELGAGR